MEEEVELSFFRKEILKEGNVRVVNVGFRFLFFSFSSIFFHFILFFGFYLFSLFWT